MTDVVEYFARAAIARARDARCSWTRAWCRIDDGDGGSERCAFAAGHEGPHSYQLDEPY